MLTVDIGVNAKHIKRVRAQRIKGTKNDKICTYAIRVPEYGRRGVLRGWKEVGTLDHVYKDGALVLSIKLLKFLQELEKPESEAVGTEKIVEIPRTDTSNDKHDSDSGAVGPGSSE